MLDKHCSSFSQKIEQTTCHWVYEVQLFYTIITNEYYHLFSDKSGNPNGWVNSVLLNA